MKYFLYFSAFLATFYAFSEETKTESVKKHIVVPPGTPTNVYVNIENTNNNNHTIKNEQQQSGINATGHFSLQSNQFVEFFQHIQIKQHIMQQVEFIKHETITHAMSLQSSGKEFIQKYKIEICLATGALIYGIFWAKLLYAAHHILKSDSWSCWKDTLTIDMLEIGSSSTIAKELLFAIQQKYQNPDNLTDFFSPLVSFMHDIEKEKKIFEQFISMHQWLDRLYLSWLFPEQARLVQMAQEKIKRLNYMKKIFLEWVADYKIAVNTKKEYLEEIFDDEVDSQIQIYPLHALLVEQCFS